VKNFIALLCFAACAQLLGAQGSVNHSGSISALPDNSDAFEFLQYELDHGATPTAIDVTVTISCTVGTYIHVSAVDWDEEIAQASPLVWSYASPATDVNVGATQAIYLTTPARTGKHPIVVRVNNFNYVHTASFDITFATSAGGLSGPRVFDEPTGAIASGHNVYGDLMVGGWDVFSLGAPTLTRQFEVDFGPTPNSAPMLLWLQGTLIDRVEISYPWAVGGTPQTVMTGSAPNGDVDGQVLFYAPALTGRVLISLDVVPATSAQSGTTGIAFWELYVDGSASVVAWNQPNPIIVKSTGSTGGGGCTASTGASALALLPLMAGVAWLRRRRGAAV
jgi:hypothetical protein